MDFFNFPYHLIENEEKIIQAHSLITPRNLFSPKNLERIIENISYGNYTDFTNLKGVVGELLANHLFHHNMKELSKNITYIDNNFIGNNKEQIGYIINSNHKYFAKLLSTNRIVILKKEKNTDKNQKFGFKNISEIDGLYQIKKKHHSKNKKKYYAIETKTGNSKIKATHIKDNIILPLNEMYNEPIYYVLIGFKEDMYNDPRNNTLNTNMTKLYHELKETNIDFTFIHFPFSKQKFINYISTIEAVTSGIIRGKVNYYFDRGEIEIIDTRGNIIKGRFFPE